MIKRNIQEIFNFGEKEPVGRYEVFDLSGIKEKTEPVDVVYDRAILEHEGKKYFYIKGESRNRVISEGIHEADTGSLIWYCETSGELDDITKSIVEALGPLEVALTETSKKDSKLISSILSKVNEATIEAQGREDVMNWAEMLSEAGKQYIDSIDPGFYDRLKKRISEAQKQKR